MAKYLIVVVAALPLICFGAPRSAHAQVAADLSAPAGAGDFVATGLSANLSAANGAISRAAAGGRYGAQGGAGSSLPSGGSLPSAVRSNSSSGYTASRAALLNSYSEVVQMTSRPPVRLVSKSVFPKASAMNSGFALVGPPGLSSAATKGIRTPRSFAGWTSATQTPVYSFLMRHERTGSVSSVRQQSRPGNSMRRRNGKRELVQSMTGMGSSGGLSR
jgi:hypothetical protein